MTERGRVDSVPVAEDTVRKVQRLKTAIGRTRAQLDNLQLGNAQLGNLQLDNLQLGNLQLGNAQPGAGVVAGSSALVSEIRQWEEQLEAIRCDMAELLAERDRWRIAHDKLRERIDRHTLEPRSEERKVQSLPQPARPRPASGESQDFTAIDRELERLNASMLRAFSSE